MANQGRTLRAQRKAEGDKERPEIGPRRPACHDGDAWVSVEGCAQGRNVQPSFVEHYAGRVTNDQTMTNVQCPKAGTTDYGLWHTRKVAGGQKSEGGSRK
jgi:hypothetical protein